MAATSAPRDLVAEVARDLLEGGDALARDITDRVHRDVPGVPADDELREATLRSGGQIIRQLVERLREADDMEEVLPPAAAIAYAQEYVHRGIDLPILLGVVRVGYAEFGRQWAAAVRNAEAPAEALVDALADSMLRVFSYIDGMSSALAVAYSDERERWSRGQEALRLDLVTAILEGRPVAEDEAEQRLGHRLTGDQRAFVVWSDADDAPNLRGSLERGARQLASRAGASRYLLLPVGRQVLGGWLAGDAARTTDDELRASLDLPCVHGVQAAIGRPADGLPGFRTSHVEALHARRVAREGGFSANTVTTYARVALTALASADLDHAAAFVTGELGPLAAPDDATRRIAVTTLVYLEEGRNRARASRRLGLHTNTIAYRLARAAELLGHGLDERAAEVEVALRLAPVVERRRAHRA